MTITNLMHVNGSDADLFSPRYFQEVEGKRPAIDPFKLWVDGQLIAFGTRQDDFGVTRIAIDLRKAAESVPALLELSSNDPLTEINRILTENEAMIPETAYLTSPKIPPANSYVNWRYRCYTEYFSSCYLDDKTEWKDCNFTYTRYLKEVFSYIGDIKASSKSVDIEPVPTSDTVVQPYKYYCYLNKYDFSEPKYAVLNVEEGMAIAESVQRLREQIVARNKHRSDNLVLTLDDVEIVPLEVDITQATIVPRDTEHVPELMDFWLGKQNAFIKFTSIDQTFNIEATYGSHTEPNMEGDFEYRHKLHDAVFKFKDAFVDRYQMLPICNGFFCYPRVIDNKVYASAGQRLSYNEKDRNRRWVMVDFTQVGGASFVHLSDLEGSMSEMILPNYDPNTQSALLVVRGRLYTPDEFMIVGNRIMFDVTKYTGVYELDRMVCRGDFKWNTRVIDGNSYTKQMTSSVDKQDIEVFKLTKDTTVVKGKKYFACFGESYFAVELKEGDPIGKDHLYPADVFDINNVHVGLAHDSNGRILFNEFYEYVNDVSSSSVKTVVANKVNAEVDLKNDDNSFVIIINKKGLDVIKHKCFEGPRPFTKMTEGFGSPVSTMKVAFDKAVRGLLFDHSTRSVIDYTRETQTLTFYADKFRKWGIANVSANWSSLLAVTDESADNSMSVKGFVVDDSYTDKYDFVVWPCLSILDFVFRD